MALCCRFDAALEAGRLLAMKKYLILSICVGMVFFLNYIGYGLAFWYGSELITNSEIAPGSVFTVSHFIIVALLTVTVWLIDCGSWNNRGSK